MFEELRTFITVVEYKNFTKAAEVLHLSQPSVSAHIKNLEDRFQTVLIHRSVKQKSIAISESGYRLYQYAKEVLQLTEEAYIKVPENDTSIQGHLRLGASLTIGEYILPAFIASFSKKYPDIELELCIDNTATIVELVKDLALDFGFVEGAISSCNYDQEYILDDHLVLALPYDKHLDPAHFDFQSLNHQKWIVRERGSGTRDYVDHFLSTYEITPKQVMMMGSNYAIMQSVSLGLGVTIISQVVAQELADQKKICIVPLDKSFHRHFSLIQLKTFAHNHVAEFFIEELKAFAAQNLTSG